MFLIISGATWGFGPTPPQPRYLNIHIWHEAETYIRHTSWQNITINDFIILIYWLGYNLQTKNKMRNIYPISGSIATILTSNFVRVTKELYPWHHHGSHVTVIQFTDQIENEDQILYLKFYMHYWLQLCQICLGDIRFELWPHDGEHVTWVQFSDQTENEV